MSEEVKEKLYGGFSKFLDPWVVSIGLNKVRNNLEYWNQVKSNQFGGTTSSTTKYFDNNGINFWGDWTFLPNIGEEVDNFSQLIFLEDEWFPAA